MKELLDMNRIPQHIAIIMDGNRRWAELHGVPRVEGHEQGYKAIHDIVDACDSIGVKYLSIYW